MSKKVLKVFLLLIFLSQIGAEYDVFGEEPQIDTCAPRYVFASASIIVVIIIRHLVQEFEIPIPYPFFCILLGILWGIGSLHSDWMRDLANPSLNSMRSLTLIYLPVIIFTMSFTIDVHSFMRCLPQILIISGPVAFFSSASTGMLMRLVIDPKWNDADGFLLGAILAAIYPVEVLQILRDNTVHQHVTVLLEGETLITAAWSLLVYRFIGNYITGWVVRWYHFVMGAVRLLVLGFPLGYLYGHFGAALMKLAYTDTVGLMTITVGMCYTSFYFIGYITKGGIIGTMVVGIVMGLEKGSLPGEIEMIIMNLWKTIWCITNGVLFINVGVLTPWFVKDLDFKDGILVLVTYLVTNITRFISFFMFSPVLSRMGYGMNFSNLMICIWSGLKNPFSITMAIDLASSFYDDNLHKAKLFFLHTVSVYLLLMFINGSCVPVLIRALGLTDISISRQINMNNCIKFINEARSRTVSILKMDRFLADANWPFVMHSTSLQHPHKKTLQKMHQNEQVEEEDNLLSFKYTFCPDCQKNVPNEPTARELKDMTKEAKMRLLKLKKTAYTRQFESGMVSMYGIRILHQAVEVAADSENLVIELDGLFKLFTKEGIFYRILRNRLIHFLARRGEWSKPPRKPARLWCYRIVNHDAFTIFSNFVALTHMVLLIYHLIYIRKRVKMFKILNVLIRFLYFSLYLIEFILKIFALSWIYVCRHGFRSYFRSHWCCLEFVIMCFTFGGAIYFALVAAVTTGKTSYYSDVVLSVLLGVRLIQLLAFLKHWNFCNTLVPSLIKYLDEKVYRHRALAFELAKNYIASEEEILENLQQIIDNEIIREGVKERIESNRLALTRRIGIAQKESPIVATIVKTKLGMRMVLNSMKEDVNDLKVSGWVDDVEYEKLMKSLTERRKFINSIQTIPPPSPKLLMKDISYMGDDPSIVEFLYANVVAKKYDPGEVVFKEGDVADFIGILISGMLAVTYTPRAPVLDKMHEIGTPPIIDHVCSMTFEEQMADYVLPGNSVGELSMLTRRPYNGMVTAETHSQLYTLSGAVLAQAFEMEPDPVGGLECRMWKYLSFKKALSVMMNTPYYRSLTHDEMKYALERSFVPTLSNYKIFVINNMMSDLILIEGTAVDFNSKDIYTAPCYIPRAVQKLILPKSSLMLLEVPVETKLLIIPAKDFDEYEIMVTEEDTCELVNDDSKLCIRHLIQNKGLLSQKSKGGKHLRGIISGLRKRNRKGSAATIGSRVSSAGPTGSTGILRGSSRKLSRLPL